MSCDLLLCICTLYFEIVVMKLIFKTDEEDQKLNFDGEK